MEISASLSYFILLGVVTLICTWFSLRILLEVEKGKDRDALRRGEAMPSYTREMFIKDAMNPDISVDELLERARRLPLKEKNGAPEPEPVIQPTPIIVPFIVPPSPPPPPVDWTPTIVPTPYTTDGTGFDPYRWGTTVIGGACGTGSLGSSGGIGGNYADIYVTTTNSSSDFTYTISYQ